jgi:hypothetical protein
MHQFCHRCGGELAADASESPFCPHCGAPQLRLSIENQSGPESAEGGAATTGAVPPPRPRQVDWKAAIRCVALVSAVAAVLSLAAVRVQVLSSIMLLWVFSGSLITLSLYQRLRPTAWMDVRIGARIGVLVGVGLALALGSATAAWGMVSRYVLHSMTSFDADMAVQMKHLLQQVPPDKVGFYLSPEFRGGMMIAVFAMMGGALLLLSTLGGAFAGLLRMRRGPV